METIKILLQILTILIAICIYIGVWVSMVKNWDKCVTTMYAYPCWERTLGNFYVAWIICHAILVISAFVWAWI